VKIFLEHNYCNLDTYDLDGMTPIALAAATKASSENLEIAQLLVEAGADLCRDDNLLLKAAKSDNLPVMKLFLANNLCWRRLEWSEVLREFSQPSRKNHEIGSLLLSWIDVDRILKISNIQRCYLLRGAIANRLDDLLEKILDESAVLDEDHKANRKGFFVSFESGCLLWPT
jgi:Ankyrin repeat.